MQSIALSDTPGFAAAIAHTTSRNSSSNVASLFNDEEY
jgi:hypothetical protein